VRRIRQSAECRFGRIEAAGRNAAPDDGCRSDGDGCCDHGREANCRPAATAARRALLALWAGSRDGDPRRDGACATIENRQSTRVDCGASRAQARVLAVTVAGDGRQCPRNADRILAVADTVTETACLRSLAAPHAGDAGKGGGILLPGDCIADPAGGLARPEIPCGSATDYAKVAAIALASAQCPRSTVDTVRLATAADYRTACLVTGPGVMTKGDCVTDPVVTQFVEVRCDTPEAAFRVTARVAAVRACPAGSADTAGRTTRCRGRPSRVCAGADVTVVAHAARRGLCATTAAGGAYRRRCAGSTRRARGHGRACLPRSRRARTGLRGRRARCRGDVADARRDLRARRRYGRPAGRRRRSRQRGGGVDDQRRRQHRRAGGAAAGGRALVEAGQAVCGGG